MCSCAHLPEFKSLRLCECLYGRVYSAGLNHCSPAVVFNLIHFTPKYCIIVNVPHHIFLSSAVSADKFRYTCMGSEITIEGVDDKKDMEETRRTFSLLGKNRLSCQTVTCL